MRPNSAMVGRQFDQQEQPITSPHRRASGDGRMTSLRTAVIAVTVAAAMGGSSALAADGALAPGKPAGVHEAARSPRLWMIGGAALVAGAGIAIAVSSSDNSQCGAACVPATTTSTS